MIGKLLRLLRSPQGRDSLLTTLTEGLSMLGMVLVFRLAKDSGDEAFERYVIVRRTVAFAFPVVLMGTMVGLTRYITMSRDDATRRRYARGALAWVVPLGALLVTVCAIVPAPLSWVCFGDYAGAPLILPLALMTFGTALHGVAYGFLRGLGHVMHANAIQFAVLALCPCLAFVFFPQDLRAVLYFTGGSWCLIAIASLAPHLLKGPDGPSHVERAQIIRYGLPRVPGDIALGALLTVPVFVVVRTFGQSLGAEYAFACTLLNLAAAAFSPVALLLLPAASAQLARGDHAALAKRVGRMMMIIWVASLALMVGFELLSRPFLRIYLGATTGELYLATSRLVFVAALPFAFFNGMRSLLDAYYQTPRNGVNLVVAMLILMAGGLLHLVIPTDWYTMGVVLIIAMSYLGWATWRDVRYVRSELQRLAARGAGELTVLVVIPDEEEGETYTASKAQARAFVKEGAKLTFFHLEDRRSPLRLLRDRGRLKKLLKQRRPDVVHVHFGSVAALFTVLTSSVPVVVTFMGDDLDRSGVRGIARPWMGGLFSQVAAFFAAGLICSDERVREHLWWRQSDAVVLPLDGDGTTHARETLEHLRSVAFHQTAVEAA